MSITQRNQTRSQSTADIRHKHVFLFNNTYQSAIFLNNTPGELTLKMGSLVVRNTASPAQVIPATTDNLADVIGIVAVDDDFVLDTTETLDINYGTSGDVNENELVLPSGVTLDTAVGNKTLRDVLNGQGFYLRKTTNNTKFDN